MSTQNKFIHGCFASALILSSSAYAGSINEQLSSLDKRLNKMERLQIHGAVEIEYGSSEDYAGDTTSDIALATAELAIESKINDNVDIQVSMLHEEDDTPLEMDVGIVNLQMSDSPLSIQLGQMYVPFGAFNSNAVSDPLTLEIGEARESAAHINYQSGDLSAGFYIFNGDIEDGAGTDKASKFGLNLAYENDNLAAGMSYISSFSDTDTLQGALTSPIVNKVAGVSAHATYSIDALSLIVEYVGAMDNFDATELAFNSSGAKPSAMNLELAMETKIAGNGSTISAAYQTSSEALALDLPKSRLLIALSSEIYDETTLAFEYLQDSDYSLADGGTDETSNTFTLQLATGF